MAGIPEKLRFAEGDRVRWSRRVQFGATESGEGTFLLEWVGIDNMPVYDVLFAGQERISLHPQFGDTIEEA